MAELEKIDIPFNDFQEMLSQNTKILFSGIFGSGKTTFLNDYFDKNEEYESIHIYPVNYAVVSNKDIFELIKHDILLQLIGKVSKEDFDKLEIPYHMTLWTYLISTNNITEKVDFLAPFLNFAGTHGSAFLKVYEQVKSLKDGFDKFHENFQEDDFEKVTAYLNTVTDEKGHIYEEDFYTDLIRILIDKIKKTTKKKVVLVVDDLDRLDPEHIFRILNIFSAHIDFRNKESDNKFDFDKVIIVCDYNNVASVFAHKYGTNADFNGFIDKFYKAIYWYDSSSFIKSIVGSYLKKVKTSPEDKFFDDQHFVGESIKSLLNVFVSHRLISFRQLKRFNNDFTTRKIILLKDLSDYWNHDFILTKYSVTSEHIIIFFLNFFKNESELFRVIDTAKTLSLRYFFEKKYLELDTLCELLFIINNDKYNSTIFFNETLEIDYSDYYFDCRISVNNRNDNTRIECLNVSKYDGVVKSKIKKDKIDLNYFEVFEEALKKFLSYKNQN